MYIINVQMIFNALMELITKWNGLHHHARIASRAQDAGLRQPRSDSGDRRVPDAPDRLDHGTERDGEVRAGIAIRDRKYVDAVELRSMGDDPLRAREE